MLIIAGYTQVDPERINNVERWASQGDLDHWRSIAHAPDIGDEMLAVHVTLFDASGERPPF